MTFDQKITFNYLREFRGKPCCCYEEFLVTCVQCCFWSQI